MTITIDERPSGRASHIVPSSGLGRLLDEFESLLLVVLPSASEAIPEGAVVTIRRQVGHSLDLIDTILSVGSARAIVYQRRQATGFIASTSSASPDRDDSAAETPSVAHVSCRSTER